MTNLVLLHRFAIIKEDSRILHTLEHTLAALVDALERHSRAVFAHHLERMCLVVNWLPITKTTITSALLLITDCVFIDERWDG